LCSSDKTNDEYEIARIIHDSFGWALTKDRTLFESIFAKDDDFFTYYPDSKSTVVGWKQFEKFLESWMDPRNRAKGFDIRNLRIVISKTGDVAFQLWWTMRENLMESLGVRKAYDGREFWRNAAGAGRYVNSICQKQTTKAQNRGCRSISGW
jgi:hypothetical protein